MTIAGASASCNASRTRVNSRSRSGVSATASRQSDNSSGDAPAAAASRCTRSWRARSTADRGHGTSAVDDGVESSAPTSARGSAMVSGLHYKMRRMAELGMNDRIAIPDAVIARELEGETVVLNLETGVYFGL